MLKIKATSPNAQEAIDAIRDTFKDWDTGSNVKIGFNSKARYDTPGKPYVAEVAMYQEFESVKRNAEGNPRKPDRPFMREAIQASKRKVIDLLKKYPDDPDRILGLVGEEVKAAIQTSIATGNWAPLAKSTVKRRRKGSDRPLQDTGYLLESVTYWIS